MFIVFSKDGHNNISHPTCFFNMWFTCDFATPPLRDVVYILSLEPGGTLWLSQSIEYGRSDSVGLPRLNHKGQYSFYLALSPRDACSWNPATMQWRNQGHMERPCVGVPADNPSWGPNEQPASPTRLESEEDLAVTPAPVLRLTLCERAKWEEPCWSQSTSRTMRSNNRSWLIHITKFGGFCYITVDTIQSCTVHCRL